MKWSLASAEDITLPPSEVRLLAEDRIISIANQSILSMGTSALNSGIAASRPRAKRAVAPRNDNNVGLRARIM